MPLSQPAYRHLFGPRLLSIQNAFNRGDRIDRFKVYFFTGLTFLFWAALLVGGMYVFGKLAAEEPFGKILVHKLLGFLFMIFFAILVFSNVVTNLSQLFLADDLYLFVTSPLSVDRLFLSRALIAGFQSGWMVTLFALPILLAAGIVFESPWWFFPWMLLIMAVFTLLPAAIGALVTTLLVKAFPARKTQDVLIIMSIALVVTFYFIIRFARPEQLFNPDLFHGFTEYFASLQAPNSPLIPSAWATEALWGGLTGVLDADVWLMLAYGLFAGLGGLAVAAWVAEHWYLDAFSKSQEGRQARFSKGARGRQLFEWLALARQPLRRRIIIKDMKTFFRETTQWTQLLLLLALVVVYLFNFKVLPLERFGLNFYYRSLVAFTNLILAGFVLSAVCVRFVLPAVSTEGRAFWILRAAPIKMRDVVLAKFVMMLLPVIVVGQALVIASNYFLGTHAFLTFFAAGLMLLISIGITALAIGVGSIMPAFHEKNVAKMATGASSIVYMVVAMFYIIAMVVMGLFPGRDILLSILSHQPMTSGQMLVDSILAVLMMILFIVAVFVPLRLGIRTLDAREF